MPAKLSRSLSLLVGLLLSAIQPFASYGAITDVDGTVRLEWNPSTSENVMGYDVFRSTRQDAGYQKLNASPIPGTAFLDDSLMDGGTYYYAIAAVDESGRRSALTYSPTPVIVELDSDGPVIVETAPYNGQGFREDQNLNGKLDGGEDANGNGLLDQDSGLTPRVPMDTTVLARVHDKNVIDQDSLSMVVLVNGIIATGELHTRAVPNTGGSDYFVQFVPDAPFPFDATVMVGIDGSDRVGNPMETQYLSFQVESAAMRTAALNAAPQADITLMDDGLRAVIAHNIELYSRSAEPRVPSLGETSTLETALAVDTKAPVVALQPTALYEAPITMRLTLDGIGSIDAADLSVLRYDAQSETGWQVASVGDGWLESMRVIEGGVLELTVRHSAIVTAALAQDVPQ